MLDELCLELLDPWEMDLATLRPMCATCGVDDLMHVYRTPLGFGCPWTGCRQFVAA